MTRSERRARTENIAQRRRKIWSEFNGSEPSDKRAGHFRRHTAFGCNCSDHAGMCHANTKHHEPLVERRNERRIIAAELNG